jgi:hypothetical protein
MNAPATTGHPSSFEAVLHEVQATLAQLLVAADEQHAALAANDRAWLEGVTQQQERLSARLARAEARRIELVGHSTADWTNGLPADAAQRVLELKTSIGESVLELKAKQALAAGLLEDKLELASETIDFLRRLVTQPHPTYSGRGKVTAGHSVLVDSRA